jgi:hypothetical protein
VAVSAFGYARAKLESFTAADEHHACAFVAATAEGMNVLGLDFHSLRGFKPTLFVLCE